MFSDNIIMCLPQNITASLHQLLKDLLQHNAKDRLQCVDDILNYDIYKNYDIDKVPKKLYNAHFLPSVRKFSSFFKIYNLLK